VVLDVSCIIHEAVTSHNTVPTENEFLTICIFVIPITFMYMFTVIIVLLKLLQIVSSDLYCVHISSLLCDNIFLGGDGYTYNLLNLEN
jgi:hypothetical protein